MNIEHVKLVNEAKYLFGYFKNSAGSKLERCLIHTIFLNVLLKSCVDCGRIIVIF